MDSERNISWFLECDLPEGPKQLEVVASAFYLGFYNDNAVISGFPRAGHGFSRKQSVDLPASSGKLEIYANYHGLDSYVQVNKPFFMRAIVRNPQTGKILADSVVPGNFRAFRDERRIQAAPRYSWQRGFVEIFDYNRGLLPVPLIQPPLEMASPRRSPNPDLRVLPFKLEKEGSQKPEERRLAYWYDTNPLFRGWVDNDSRREILDQIHRVKTAWGENPPEPLLKDGNSLLYRLPANQSGHLRLKVEAQAPCRLIALWDETLVEEEIMWWRNDSAQLAIWNLPAGEFDLKLYEPYTMQFLELRVEGGPVKIDRIELITVENPKLAGLAAGEQEPLRKAGLNTLAQNCADIFMDCPSRERTGWLCDSLLSARAYWHLTGDLGLETDFLENYLNAPLIGAHQAIPMCYPADHPDGNFAPADNSWFILQLEDYLKRGGEKNLVHQYRDKVATIIAHMNGFLNSYGLLQNLKGWQFMGWTDGDHLQSDVNFQQNLLYAKALQAAGRIFSVPEWTNHGVELEKRCRNFFWDGTKFCEHIYFKDGKLQRTEEITADSQYLARLFGMEEAKGDSLWWRRMVNGGWDSQNAFDCMVWAPQPLFGLLWRWMCLAQADERELMASEMAEILGPMAEQTGTLWEFADAKASLNHGCMGITACLLDDKFDNLKF